MCVCNHHPLSENRDFSGTEPPLDLRAVCTFKFVNFNPEEKTRALFLCQFNCGSSTNCKDTFFQIIIFCQKITISQQPNVCLTTDQSVDLSGPKKTQSEPSIRLCSIVVVRQISRTHFSKKGFSTILPFCRRISGNEFKS